ncbi:UPF0481 protein [Quillaja saponaria]|uniref:UPF0481 protein n=1 Tax=Quillaja saponaria TaxID=32244 RepID=A0AAD7PV41_QUISA|nr:UPF0481 protein [Quillaja saponaria]
MGSSKLMSLVLRKISRRKFHNTASTSNWRDSIKEELNSKSSCLNESETVCIYKVPAHISQVQPKAYKPSYISIGPYHHGALHLQAMEKLKFDFYCRLFDPVNGNNLDTVMDALEKLEDPRSFYLEDEVKNISIEKFLSMMLIDGSFIIQLLKESEENQFKHIPSLKRWMLPIIRRELIMLENQLPFSVLCKLFELTGNQIDSDKSDQTFYDLAIQFFNPLLQVHPRCNSTKKMLVQEGHRGKPMHFLDLVRSSILPDRDPSKLKGEEPRGTQPYPIRSITELKEVGVKIKNGENRELLQISFKRKFGLIVRELTIPPLYINDHKGTLFRNMLAYEKCHKQCNPDVTTYLFFFDGLINSAKDVALLHYKGVLHHSLGSNRKVAKFINNLCKELVRDKDESYLYKVVDDANYYSGSFYARKRASFVHYYLSSWVVGMSTIGALFALYLTFIQTASGIRWFFRRIE